MCVNDEVEYYIQREQAERCLAAEATNEAARTTHLTMASEYRERAKATYQRAKLARMTSDELIRMDPGGGF